MTCADDGTRRVPGGMQVLCVVLVLVLCGTGTARGQLISLKTAPVATGDQFLVFPAQHMGMGGLSIAVVDSTGDPFVNPAKAGRLSGTWAFSTPLYYTVTGSDGAARTLPVGALFGRGAWFGGLHVAMQHMETAAPPSPAIWPNATFDLVSRPVYRTEPLLRDRSSNNHYASVLAGVRLSGSFSIAGRFFWAGLEAADGVDLLYPRSEHIDQDGHHWDVRLGLLGELEGHRSFEVLLVHHRVDMTHDVGYVDVSWDATIEQAVATVREERNLDRTNTWGLHLGYVQPFGSEGWRIGGVLTGNRKSHPKIPNYELMNIPRDPGTSWAYNVGLGLARTYEKTTFGVDFIYEPIFSDTWVEAEERISIPERDLVIEAGEKTLANDFDFANTTARVGLRRDGRWTELQLGMQVRTIRYWLKQEDFVEDRYREQHEAWSEWTASWGIGVKLSDLHIRYVGRLTTGTGRPGVATPTLLRVADFSAGGDIIVAPRGPLTLEDARVFTHQLSVVVPINAGGRE